jgi:hypothetical protein
MQIEVKKVIQVHILQNVLHVEGKDKYTIKKEVEEFKSNVINVQVLDIKLNILVKTVK